MVGHGQNNQQMQQESYGGRHDSAVGATIVEESKKLSTSKDYRANKTEVKVKTNAMNTPTRDFSKEMERRGAPLPKKQQK